MHPFFRIGFTLVLLSLLVACGSAQSDQMAANLYDEIEPIAVQLMIQPPDVEPGSEVKLQVLVTQKEERVNDANEVQFEVWRQGDPEHLMLDAVFQGDGIYEVAYRFEEEAMYYVMYHVTARGMHSMNKHKVPVGEVPDTTPEEDRAERSQWKPKSP